MFSPAEISATAFFFLKLFFLFFLFYEWGGGIAVIHSYVYRWAKCTGWGQSVLARMRKKNDS